MDAVGFQFYYFIKYLIIIGITSIGLALIIRRFMKGE